jgi:hypothetical protein
MRLTDAACAALGRSGSSQHMSNPMKRIKKLLFAIAILPLAIAAACLSRA